MIESSLLMVLIIPSLEIKSCSHNAWIVALKHATNSAFIVDATMIDCLTLFQDTALSANRNKYPNMDFLFSRHIAKSKYEYPTTSELLDLLYMSI